MKKFSSSRLWFAMVILLLAITACNPTQLSEKELASTYAAQTQTAMPTDTATQEETPAPESTAMPTSESTPEPVGAVGPVDFPENVNPLTGLAVADATILDRRPVLVKVANYPASGRPHAGLSFADIVFDYYIGYGSNRFAALYYGEDSSKIGPVRSGRLTDPQLASLYEGILGFQSAYITILDEINEILGDRAFNGGLNICPAICDDGRNVVYSVFADSTALTELAEERGVDQKQTLEGMAFDPETPEGGTAGEDVLILYSNLNRGEWVFDEESGKYLRWIEDTTGASLEMIPLVDSVTDEQLAFSNVVVLFAYHNEVTGTVYEINIWDNPAGGDAVIFRDGQMYEVTWATPTKTQPIRFFDENGDAFALKPGNTWISIMGNNTSIVQEVNLWKFTFMIP